ncbi:hypothetical protein [Nocardia wallacei]|uniref:hypothetical protein n=1 Tax=Nocardia wallacei TaxID=480035 RepID=UPI002454904F|nr:hypothetical protein [Nocardia wallacei]
MVTNAVVESAGLVVRTFSTIVCSASSALGSIGSRLSSRCSGSHPPMPLRRNASV